MKRMSKDLAKFDSPDHKLLIMLINHARIQKGCTLDKSDEQEEAERKSRILKLCPIGVVSRGPSYVDDSAFCLGHCLEQQKR